MKTPKPILHGRDHAPGGADPIPNWPSGGGGGHVIQDELVSLPQRGKLNFAGPSVQAIDAPGADLTNVQIKAIRPPRFLAISTLFGLGGGFTVPGGPGVFAYITPAAMGAWVTNDIPAAPGYGTAAGAANAIDWPTNPWVGDVFRKSSDANALFAIQSNAPVSADLGIGEGGMYLIEYVLMLTGAAGTGTYPVQQRIELPPGTGIPSLSGISGYGFRGQGSNGGNAILRTFLFGQDSSAAEVDKQKEITTKLLLPPGVGTSNPWNVRFPIHHDLGVSLSGSAYITITRLPLVNYF